MKTKDFELIEFIAERLYQKREKLDGILISWDTLTGDYFKKDIPEDELERKQWIEERAIWVVKLNEMFLRNNYPVRLKVVYGKGINLKHDKEAVNDVVVTKLADTVRKMEKTRKLFKDLQPGFPDAKKMLAAAERSINDTIYGFLGRIEASKLSQDNKSKLKALVQECLPFEE
jgi:hypothetical protein